MITNDCLHDHLFLRLHFWPKNSNFLFELVKLTLLRNSVIYEEKNIQTGSLFYCWKFKLHWKIRLNWVFKCWEFLKTIPHISKLTNLFRLFLLASTSLNNFWLFCQQRRFSRQGKVRKVSRAETRSMRQSYKRT